VFALDPVLTALAVATALLMTMTALPLIRHPHWLFRSMEFPRLQLAVLASALIVADVYLLDLRTPLSWGLALAASACLLWQLWWILPYTRLWPVEVKSVDDADAARRLRIITANVLAPNRNARALLDLIDARQPEIVVTLESDPWWQDQLDCLLPRMPYSIKCPRDNLYGMHVYSRLPLESVTTSYLVEDDKPSMHASVRLRTGDKVAMHFLHPAPPSPSENKESSERDAELVIVARSVAGSEHPIIVTGDLNDVAWSPTTRLFRKISGLLDPRIGRGMFNTFHAHYPFMRWPLDHLFHSRHFTIGAIERLAPIGSDHFPLFAELWFTPAQGADQKGLDADRGDRDRARAKANDQGVSASQVPRPEN
jgi:endonuclease/exonuclease/phosphatase (EEP) superfamily protein YafD